MNILFVTNKNVYPLIGGIERITYSVAEALRNIYGMRCFSLYTQENKLGKTTEDVFKRKECLCAENGVGQVVQYIQEEQINVVIAQGSDSRVNNLMPLLREAIDHCEGVKLLFVYHQMPGFELVPMDNATLWNRLIHSNKSAALKQIATQILLCVSPRLSQRMVEKKYRMPYEKSDKVVLLSEGFIPQYNHFVRGGEQRYCAIPNMLSFLKVTQGLAKQKEVLVVSRMDERQKRIKHVLRVWCKAYKADWTLRIVGYGEDLEYYKKLACKWDLRNITFEGLQDPLPYYQRASIFLMVSAFEGWGLTTTEAQQCGCVPIAFDSYSAVHDIIQSGRNGYVVPNDDIDEYVRVLKELMNNDTLRAELAANAQKDVQRFSRENIAKQWKALLENL